MLLEIHLNITNVFAFASALCCGPNTRNALAAPYAFDPIENQAHGQVQHVNLFDFTSMSMHARTSFMM